MIAIVKLETLKLNLHTNHFALKTKLYLKATLAAFQELNLLHKQMPQAVTFDLA